MIIVVCPSVHRNEAIKRSDATQNNQTQCKHLSFSSSLNRKQAKHCKNSCGLIKIIQCVSSVRVWGIFGFEEIDCVNGCRCDLWDLNVTWANRRHNFNGLGVVESFSWSGWDTHFQCFKRKSSISLFKSCFEWMDAVRRKWRSNLQPSMRNWWALRWNVFKVNGPFHHSPLQSN